MAKITQNEGYRPGLVVVVVASLIIALIIVALAGCIEMRQAFYNDTGQMFDSSGNPIYPVSPSEFNELDKRARR